MKIALFAICMTFISPTLFAQDDGRIVKIPVIFHVLNTDTMQYITRDIILKEIDDSNQDFQMINPDIVSASSLFENEIGNAKVQFYIKDIKYVKIRNS